jgi:hypothetical protein
MIINYWDFHITLNELARSVKPNGELLNTVAEVALYAINPTGRKAKKQVLPLRISVCMVFPQCIFVISLLQSVTSNFLQIVGFSAIRTA